jgi:hypothetical protein
MGLCCPFCFQGSLDSNEPRFATCAMLRDCVRGVGRACLYWPAPAYCVPVAKGQSLPALHSIVQSDKRRTGSAIFANSRIWLPTVVVSRAPLLQLSTRESRRHVLAVATPARISQHRIRPWSIGHKLVHIRISVQSTERILQHRP